VYQEKAKQNQRIRSLFHRQLAVPLANIKGTLMDYKSWEADQGNSNDMDNELDGVPPNVALNYQKASASYNARKQYEDQLMHPVQSEADKLKHFMVHILFLIFILYERYLNNSHPERNSWTVMLF
jgi:squamous cell carcinoma antigen recognized by T-cells 3